MAQNAITPKDVATLILNAKRLIVFTGAGMSSESGIDTFRGNGGFWSGIFGKLFHFFSFSFSFFFFFFLILFYL